MKKYVKKPIPIHAMKWNGNIKDLFKPQNKKYFGNMSEFGWNFKKSKVLQIKSLEGVEKCPIGDYIVVGIHDELYPCDPKIFKETYREIR